MTALLRHPPSNIARYLWAVLWEIPFLWTFAWAFGVWSLAYGVIYCIFTAIILYTICRIALDSLNGRHWRARAVVITFLLALIPSKTAFLGLPRPLNGYLMISAVEGFFLVWAGTLAAFAAPYTKRPSLIFPLALFWLVLALYDFGWVLHGHTWDKINWVVPPATGMLAFSFLAYRLRAVPRDV